jgi:hypothetical protein
VLLFEAGTLKEARIFSQELRMKIEVLERGKGAQALDLKGVLYFLSGQRPKEVGEGLFIALTQKELLGGFPLDKSGEHLWSPA